MKLKKKNWFGAVTKEFFHPSDILWKTIELQATSSRLQDKDFKSPILDVGCGDGRLMKVFLFPKKNLVGIDVERKSVTKAQTSGVYQKVLLADARKMPFKNQTFNTVISFSTIHLIPDLKNTLKEIHRVLKKDGLLIFTVPSSQFSQNLFWSQVLKKIGLKKSSKWYQKKRNQKLSNRYLFQPQRWEKELKRAGFQEIKHSFFASSWAVSLWDFLASLVFLKRKICPFCFIKNEKKSRHRNEFIQKRLKGLYKKEIKSKNKLGGLVFIAVKR